MKLSRKFKLLILLLLSLSVYFIYKFTNHHNITYTVLGDGLSLGIDCYGVVDYSYSDYIKDYLLETNKLKTYSKKYVEKDMTIDKLHNTLLSVEKMSENDTKNNIRTILRDTDYLTMTIGLNDLFYKLSLTSDFTEENLNIIIDEIQESFNELIEEIRKYYNRPIYIIGYYDIPGDNKYFKKAITKLNNIYKENKQVEYISTKIISENSEMFLPNPESFYPNYKGYRLISTKIIDKMAKLLEK